MPSYSTMVLPDGGKLAFEIWGSNHLGRCPPIVLIGGLSSLRGDWDRLGNSLAQSRPVLIYDHRGIGDSQYSTAERNDEITIKSMAMDLLFLIAWLDWKEVSLCGYSLGGLIAQQLLFLPHDSLTPVSLPFRVTHVILAGTFCSALRDERYRPHLAPPAPGRSYQEKRQLVRASLEQSFDPTWVHDPANAERFEWWIDRMAHGRPLRTIMKQAHAFNNFDFTGLHEKLPRDVRFLIIHGTLDGMVPFYCVQETLQRIPWATPLQTGPLSGQVETLAFGHHFYEYFDIQVWCEVVDRFLTNSLPNVHMAKL